MHVVEIINYKSFFSIIYLLKVNVIFLQNSYSTAIFVYLIELDISDLICTQNIVQVASRSLVLVGSALDSTLMRSSGPGRRLYRSTLHSAL